MSIKAIFYRRKVIHQVPEGSIVPSSDPRDDPPLFSFSSVATFIIPDQSLCGNLISLVPPPYQPPSHPTKTKTKTKQPTATYRILGHPVCLTSPTYPRNEFIFNFCLVLSTTEPDSDAYRSVVCKLAHLMHSLEEQSRFLSRDTSPPQTGRLYSLCGMLISDLNNYCECMIPLDDFNTLNLKLFPTYPPPPPVRAWHVPIFSVRPESLMDENWDLTMQRILPHIDGINSVKHISILSDADLALTKQCLQHLLYYGCMLLLDIFSFNAIYAPTAEFSTTIAADEDMQHECARYVNMAFAPTTTEERRSHAGTTATTIVGSLDSSVEPDMMSIAAGDDDDIWPLSSSGTIVDGVGIVELFAALKQGQSVREWYTENSDMLANIDLRRFITFGVIKGFVYRVHKYAFAVNQYQNPNPKRACPTSGARLAVEGQRIRDEKGKGAQSRKEGKKKNNSNNNRLLAPHCGRSQTQTQAKAIIATSATGASRRMSAAGILEKKPSRRQRDLSTTYHDSEYDGTQEKPSHFLRHHQPSSSHRRRHRSRTNPSRASSSNPSSPSSSSSSSTVSAADEDTVQQQRASNYTKTRAEASDCKQASVNRLWRYLDGNHSFDQICTEMEISEVELEGRLKGKGWRSRDEGKGGNLFIDDGLQGRLEKEGGRSFWGEVVIIQR